MATVKRCDRCGAIYDLVPNEEGFVVRQIDPNGYIQKQFDLCEDCEDQLVKFMAGGRVFDFRKDYEPCEDSGTCQTCTDA